MAVILVIEDDPGLRDLLEEALSGAGHLALAASNGNDGVKLCSAHPLQLVITDILMPEKEGLETIQEIRSKFPLTPILAMSGAPDGWKVLELARRLGADETLSKPFAPTVMLAFVDKLLKAA